MPRRWVVMLATLLALTALACKDPGDTRGAGRTPTTGASTPGGSTGTTLPSAMAALGDSLTEAVGTCLVPSPCPRNSWSTGDGRLVDSHYRRIVSQNPSMRDNAHNLAKAGARVADLPAQARAAVDTKAEYVTILIGGNDACRRRVEEMTSVADFRASLDDTLRVLKRGLPQAQVLVASVPDIYHLWEIGHGKKVVTHVWQLGICQSMLANPTSTAAADARRRAEVRDRVDAYNRQLSRACRDYGSKCRYDGGAVHAIRFDLTQLSALDYFHPNVSGQNELARVSYRAPRP